jgi:hypothetical protein
MRRRSGSVFKPGRGFGSILATLFGNLYWLRLRSALKTLIWREVS